MATAPKTTKIADDPKQDKPQSTSPGDAPADTYDPTERVSSAAPDKGAAAAAGFQTVNAVKPVEGIKAPAVSDNRSETYEQIGPDGKTYTVTHKIGTGETTAVPKA